MPSAIKSTVSNGTYESIVANIEPVVRKAQLEGKEYLVVPMVMLTEGVHNGSEGALYYPGEELAKFPSVWDHKPIVVYHPTMGGKPISACRPEVINTRKISLILQTGFKNSKLRAEAWLDPERVAEVDDRILDAINKGEVLEVSTGLFTDNEVCEGEWNGEKYTAKARNYRPDHLAILPDQRGACSVADGAGLLRNQQGKEETMEVLLARVHNALGKSYQAIIEELTKLLPEPIGDAMGPYVVDVYPTYFVFQRGK